MDAWAQPITFIILSLDYSKTAWIKKHFSAYLSDADEMLRRLDRLGSHLDGNPAIFF
jgi:hypothetical protein